MHVQKLESLFSVNRSPCGSHCNFAPPVACLNQAIRGQTMLVNFSVHVSRKSFLAAVIHYISKGFCTYTTGSVSVEKLPKMINKFDCKYGVLDSKNDFDRKRRNGVARCRLVVFYPADNETTNCSQKADFILLATKGAGPVYELERMSEVKPGSPLRYDTLILRKEAGLRGGGNVKGSWSWYLNQKAYKEFRESCIHAVKMRGLKRAKVLTGQLMNYPGFHGVRKQRASIFRSMKRTGIHAGHSEKALDFIPAKQYWVRKGKKETETLRSLLKQRQ